MFKNILHAAKAEKSLLMIPILLIILCAMLIINPPRRVNIPDVKLAMVRIYNGNGFICSGTVVEKDTILTAAHCLVNVEKASDLVIYDQTMTIVRKIYRIVYNEGSDLGILNAEVSDLFSAPIEFDIYKVINHSKQLRACGFAHGGHMYCFIWQHKGSYGDKFSGNGMFFHGMSGGPIFDVETGHIIGVISGFTIDHTIVSPIIELYYLPAIVR
jgi:hypothetical protein